MTVAATQGHSVMADGIKPLKIRAVSVYYAAIFRLL